MTAGIYEIRNAQTGVRYIGSAQCIKTRLSQHLTMLKGGRHHSIALQRAWDKYGSNCFRLSTVVILEDRELLTTEQRFLDAEHRGETYNIAKDAVAWMKGRKHSPEAIAQMSESRKGNKSRTGVPSHWLGKKLSDEHKANLKAAKAVVTQETRQKMRDAKVGFVPYNKGARQMICLRGHQKYINGSGKAVCRECANLNSVQRANKIKD